MALTDTADPAEDCLGDVDALNDAETGAADAAMETDAGAADDFKISKEAEMLMGNRVHSINIRDKLPKKKYNG